MKVLLVLCLTAVVLTAEISAYTFRGVDDRDVIPLPNFPVKPGSCTPGTCVVRQGAICQCTSHGIVYCPLNFWTPLSGYCRCTPGEILPTKIACLCPKSGLMPVMGCSRVFPPLFPSKGSRASARQADNEIVGSSKDDAMRDCGYYQCYPTQSGQQCVWIPCSNGR